MKANRPSCSILVLAVICSLLRHTSTAAVTIVDTFDQGGFTISCCNPADETVTLPFANRRLATFNPTLPGSVVGEMRGTLDSGAGKLSIFISGTGPAINSPLGFTLIYAGPGPYAINDYSHFILGFSELSGAGSLYVELGSAPGTDGIHRIDLTGPGDVLFSVADVRPTTSHTADSFRILRFVFEARSIEFSFTLDEIRLVPEPSGTVLVLAAGGLLLTRRRRAVRED